MADGSAGLVITGANAPGYRSGRRVGDKILVAFHHACDQGDLATAEELVSVAGRAITRTAYVAMVERRRSRESLVAAYERLWHLRHRYQGE